MLKKSMILMVILLSINSCSFFYNDLYEEYLFYKRFTVSFSKLEKLYEKYVFFEEKSNDEVAKITNFKFAKSYIETIYRSDDKNLTICFVDDKVYTCKIENQKLVFNYYEPKLKSTISKDTDELLIMLPIEFCSMINTYIIEVDLYFEYNYIDKDNIVRNEYFNERRFLKLPGNILKMKLSDIKPINNCINNNLEYDITHIESDNIYMKSNK